MLKTKSRIVKVMLIVLATIMLMSVVGCDEDEKTPDSTAESSANATASASIEQGDTEITETNSATAEADTTATLQESATAEAEKIPESSATANVSPIGTSENTAKPTATKTNTPKPTATQGMFSNAKVGDVIKFGHYEQDNDLTNGKEEIEWIVLDKEGNKALVTSKYALDAQPYNTAYEAVTWETCTVRIWLNGTFLNETFSGTEQSKIVTATVVNNDNPEFDIDGGGDTQDKVFLLSIDEANQYFSSNEARKLQGTEYANENNLLIGEWIEDNDNCCWWWLRSPGRNSGGAAVVVWSGEIDCAGNGFHPTELYSGIRPAMWINI